MLGFIVKSIGPSHRQNVLAALVVELQDEVGNKIVINDIRILRNRSGQLWVAMPSFPSISENNGKFLYLPTVELNGSLQGRINILCLERFERWQAEQAEAGVQHAS